MRKSLAYGLGITETEAVESELLRDRDHLAKRLEVERDRNKQRRKTLGLGQQLTAEEQGNVKRALSKLRKVQWCDGVYS
jgi:hypothetical protein